MSGGTACRTPDHRPAWRVIQRKGNASAFNGYHWQGSAWSAVRCPLSHGPGEGGRVWRTTAKYVDSLPDGN